MPTNWYTKQNTIYGEVDMLTFNFLYVKDDEYFYEYYVENDKDAPGIIAKKGDKGRVVTLSLKDPFKNYAYHAIYGIDTAEKNGTVAWY